MEITKKYLRNLVQVVKEASEKVHNIFGPDFYEQAYLESMIHELAARNINYRVNVEVPIKFKGDVLNSTLTCDLVIENLLAVEIKVVEDITPIHISEILTYMAMLELPIGLFLNFDCSNIKRIGQKTFTNEFYKNFS